MCRMTIQAAIKSGRSGDRLKFYVLRIPRGALLASPRAQDLWLHVGPGDQGEPVGTIMLLGED